MGNWNTYNLGLYLDLKIIWKKKNPTKQFSKWKGYIYIYINTTKKNIHTIFFERVCGDQV